MSIIPSQPGPNLVTLFNLFSPADDIPEYERVPPYQVPDPYRALLVHEHHMTVTVEAHHGDFVDVKVLATRRDGNSYARKILLELQKTGRVVQFGIVRINLDFCSEAVRKEILAERIPLGRVLIEHDVLRRIEPTSFLRVVPSPAMMAWFNMDKATPTYGRLAIIHCDEKPAIELLEIVIPETIEDEARTS